jgi:hypothetical protein
VFLDSLLSHGAHVFLDSLLSHGAHVYQLCHDTKVYTKIKFNLLPPQLLRFISLKPLLILGIHVDRQVLLVDQGTLGGPGASADHEVMDAYDSIVYSFLPLDLPFALHRLFHRFETIDNEYRIPLITESRRILGTSFDLTIVLTPPTTKIVGHANISFIVCVTC